MMNIKQKLGSQGKIILQSLYLTVTLFLDNNVLTFASAGAYSFLLSIIPIIMMILVVLIRILRTTPESLMQIFNTSQYFFNTFDIQPIIDSILSVKKVGFFEIILGFSIFWMARRLFSSIMQGIQCIFKVQAKTKTLTYNFLIIAMEVFLIIIVSTAIFVIFAIKSLLKTDFFEKFSSGVFIEFLDKTMFIMPFVLFLILVTFIYKFATSTKPSWKSCFFTSLGCISSFFLVESLLSKFINMNKYNLVYGVLSNLIVLLLEVFIFFILLFFFAQFLFVHQFFDTLLLSELYLLPSENSRNFIDVFKRRLFLKPSNFMKECTLRFENDEIILTEDDSSTDIYYVAEGKVAIISKNGQCSYSGPGVFFGELACIMHVPRSATIKAIGDTVVLRISQKMFKSLLDSNPIVNQRAISLIAAYFNQVY